MTPLWSLQICEKLHKHLLWPINCSHWINGWNFDVTNFTCPHSHLLRWCSFMWDQFFPYLCAHAPNHYTAMSVWDGVGGVTQTCYQLVHNKILLWDRFIILITKRKIDDVNLIDVEEISSSFNQPLSAWLFMELIKKGTDSRRKQKTEAQDRALSLEFTKLWSWENHHILILQCRSFN